LLGQHRYARTRGGSGRSARSSEELGSRAVEPEDAAGLGLPDVPPRVLDEWDKDAVVQEALDMFTSEELKGKKMMSYRDVARILEVMGCDRETFTSMFTAESDDDADVGKGGGKGMGKGMGKKGGAFDEDDEFDFGQPARSRPGPKGARGLGKGQMAGGMGDFDDDDGFGFGGKGGGRPSYAGKGGIYDDMDLGGKGGGYGGKGKKGAKGGSKGFDDDDDFGSFSSSFGGGKRGGKGGGKGKYGGKGGYGF